MRTAIALALTFASQFCFAGFVQVDGHRFTKDGADYSYLGANFWPAMNLGAPAGTPGADRARLTRELDRLRALGVKNLRIMALTEGPDDAPWRMVPALQGSDGALNRALLQGLDHALIEIGRRGMTAVLCLGNFWPWSGGFAQYLLWSGAGPIPYPPPAPGGDWGRYQRHTAVFYGDAAAVARYRAAVQSLVTRVNSLSGVAYRDDPAIMAWQLANEPRGVDRVESFNRWISETAAFIKGLDPNHLVSAGTEGMTANPEGAGLDLALNHASPHVDYVTAHLWVQNWGLYDPARDGETYAAAEEFMGRYLAAHNEAALAIGKPLVLEEFGIARDGGSFDATAPTTARDRYFAAVFEAVARHRAADGALRAANFWAWAGEGRPVEAGGIWRPGQPFTGDPPHEFQGWYGVYESDASTLAVLRRAAAQASSR